MPSTLLLLQLLVHIRFKNSSILLLEDVWTKNNGALRIHVEQAASPLQTTTVPSNEPPHTCAYIPPPLEVTEAGESFAFVYLVVNQGAEGEDMVCWTIIWKKPNLGFALSKKPVSRGWITIVHRVLQRFPLTVVIGVDFCEGQGGLSVLGCFNYRGRSRS